MSKERKEEYDVIPLTAAAWRDQKLIAAELRRLREASGMTQEALAEKLGEPYTEKLIARYEDGSAEVMETWTVFDIVEALGATPMDIAPKSLIARQCLESGYADLNEESRRLVDGVISAVLKGQRQTP
ncbi:MAG: helix-turn-helix domain-containing protein [Oscillibacter sp.]|nr:helix-turn-helix domain-containing protein [Oscillibacter sp.]